MKDREITREEAIKRLEEGAPFSELYDPRWEDALALAIKALKDEPVKHGHWIIHFDDLFPEDSSVECSVCHEYEGIMANDNYCPNCGAKMDEVENELL
jgi:NADH pyrophosphatase NudC (nudix superfamily)